MTKRSKTTSPSEEQAKPVIHSQRKLPFRGRPADSRLNEAIDAALEERFDTPVRP